MNGYEASAAIRAFPDMYIRNIPIIAMTEDAFAKISEPAWILE